MFDGAIDDLPGDWFAALARVAGADDIAELMGATAALFDVAVPHDTLVLSYQRTSAAFERGLPTTDAAIEAATAGITAQAIATVPVNRSITIDATTIPFLEDHVATRDWAQALALAIPYDGLLEATAVLYRRGEQGWFGPDAIRAASMVALLVGRALDRLLEQQQAQAFNKAMIGFLNDLPVGLIMLDWDWSSVFVNKEGYRQALRWTHAPAEPPRNAHPREDYQMPAEVYLACHAIRNRGFEVEGDPERADEGAHTLTVQHPQRPDLRLSVTASQSLDTPGEPPKFLIRFYGMATRTEANFEPTEEQLKLLAQLTAAERSVALLVREGLSNRDIADRLHREVSTVKDHLTHIFDKLAIRSRVQLARMLS